MKLTDIARLAGVSVTTASYVVNGKAAAQRISPATVERVLAVVEEHAYRPDQQAAGLRRGHSRSLGFILPDLENPSYARLAKCLERLARQNGYQLLIASSDDQPETERQVLALFRARRCDALIVASCLPTDDPTYRQAMEAGIPVVGVDRALDDASFASIVSDDFEAGKQLTATLLAPEPRHIVLLGARTELSVSRARAAGFRAALEGFRGQVSVLEASSFSRAAGRAAMETLVQQTPDAVLTTAYVLLEGVLDTLRSQERLATQPNAAQPTAAQRNAAQPIAPSQIRLATFGDTQLLDFLPVRVNAIAQQHERLAERVIETVMAALHDGEYRPGVQAIPRILIDRQHAEE